MQAEEHNALLQFSRQMYQALLPRSWRDRLHRVPVVRGLRANLQSEIDAPYVLLEQRHIANLRVMLDRMELLRQLPRNAVVAEIGVAGGAFSQCILDCTQPQRLHLIDAWDSSRYPSDLQQSVRQLLQAQITSGQVHVHHGYSTELLPQFDDGSFDWVYIDTDHTYTTTRRELELCRHKVKPGGIIAGHDYVTGDWKLRNRYGVVEAVNEFCVTYGWEMIFLTHEPHRHLSYALREI